MVLAWGEDLLSGSFAKAIVGFSHWLLLNKCMNFSYLDLSCFGYEHFKSIFIFEIPDDMKNHYLVFRLNCIGHQLLVLRFYPWALWLVMVAPFQLLKLSEQALLKTDVMNPCPWETVTACCGKQSVQSQSAQHLLVMLSVQCSIYCQVKDYQTENNVLVQWHHIQQGLKMMAALTSAFSAVSLTEFHREVWCSSTSSSSTMVSCEQYLALSSLVHDWTCFFF